MKILFLVPQAFFCARGTPINIRNVVTTLADAGHTIDLLCFPWGEYEEIKRVNVVRCRSWPVHREVSLGLSVARAWVDFRMFLRALGLCLQNHYDVIHAVDESSFFAWLLAKWFKAKLIYDVDTCISEQLGESSKWFYRALAPLALRLERCAIRESVFTITACQSLSDWARRLVPGAVVLQIEHAPLQPSFNQQAMEKAARLREDLKLGDAPIVIYIGDLSPYQGGDLLIRSMPGVCRKCPEARCLIIGGGPSEIDRLREVARSLDIAGAVLLCGEKSFEDIPAYLALASVLVSPCTRGENTPLEIYTYMQSGKPIVATRLPNHTQVLDDQCAILVRPNPDDLAAGILRALTEPLWAAALAREAQARAAARYTLASFRHKVRMAYSEFVRADV